MITIKKLKQFPLQNEKPNTSRYKYNYQLYKMNNYFIEIVAGLIQLESL